MRKSGTLLSICANSVRSGPMTLTGSLTVRIATGRRSDHTLRIRQVVLRRSIRRDSLALHIADHAHDFTHGMLRDAVSHISLDVLANRILAGKVFADERLIDDDDWHRLGIVGRLEGTAG